MSKKSGPLKSSESHDLTQGNIKARGNKKTAKSGKDNKNNELSDLPEIKPDGLTHKQWLFVQEYIVDLNATQAAIRAGYSVDTAKEIGYENLTKPHVRSAIQEAMNLRSERTKITADRVLTELAKLGFADIRKILTPGGHLRDLSCLDDDIAAAVQSVEVVTRLSGAKDEKGNQEIEHVHKIRLADKKASLELLAKNLDAFVEKSVVTHEFGESIRQLNHEQGVGLEDIKKQAGVLEHEGKPH